MKINARLIVEALDVYGSVFIVYEPGNVTRYNILITRATAIIDAIQIQGISHNDDWHFVSVVDKGCYPFELTGHVAPGYLKEKVGLVTDDCAYHVAMLLNAIGIVNK